MKHTVHIDFETRSTVDLRKTGVYPYAAHGDTDVWCAAYAFDDGPVELWVPPEPCPQIIEEAVFFKVRLVAHNANFERVIWDRILTPRYGWPRPKVEQWYCTMAMAYAMALPGSLDGAAQALRLDYRKDQAGHELMLRMCRPRKREPLTWWTDEDRLQRLYEYCKQDVEVERALEKRLLPLRPDEQETWWLDQTINDRGVGVDLRLCNQARNLVTTAKAQLNDEMRDCTNGAVTSTSQVRQLVAWLETQGVKVASLDKEAIDVLLGESDQSLPGSVRRVLEIRREAAKAAVSKIDALLNGRDADGQARGLLQFHAASTGRWAGRRFQPQNIKRPHGDVEKALELVAKGDYYAIKMLHGNPLEVVGDCLRGMVRAPKGRVYFAADFANIEGRGLAWLAGEEWKLDAFRAFDAGKGDDLYKLAYARAFHVPIASVTKDDRQVGKVMELALGYEGGVGAFQKMAKSLGVKVTDEQANDLKQAWRRVHVRTVELWHDLNTAALSALMNRGKAAIVRGKLVFKTNGSFLWLRLPSGRALCYPYPRIAKMVWAEGPEGRRGTFEKGRVPLGWKSESEPFPAVSYFGKDSYTGKWGDCYGYGGLWTENVVQALARDILRDAMFRIEKAGYDIVLHVHDEIVAERAAVEGDLKEFEAIMAEVPDWAQGFPIAVEGWRGERYRK